MNGTSFHAANLVLAMALELIAFAAVGYGASHLTDSTALGALLAAAAVLTSVVLWGLFAAPRARYRHPLGVLAVKALIFAAAAVAPAVNGHPILGIALGSAVALKALALVGTWERDQASRRA